MSHLFRVQPLLRLVGATKTTTRQLTSSTPEAKTWIPNCAMKRGPRSYKDHWYTKDGMCMWVLMPGIHKENVSVNVTGNVISFKGTEVLDVPDINCPDGVIIRKYEGSVVVDPIRFDAANVKAEIANGVLWLRVPNLSH